MPSRDCDTWHVGVGEGGRPSRRILCESRRILRESRRILSPIREAKHVKAWDAEDGRAVGRVEVPAEHSLVEPLPRGG